MKFIFNIDKTNQNRTIVRIFGIKLSFYKECTILDYFIKPVTKLVRNLKIKKFVSNHKKYVSVKKNKIKKRLILTTGNISLINAIAAMNQEDTQVEEFEDYLYIWSVNKNKDFRDCCEKIASLHNFKKIFHFEDFLPKQILTFSQRYANQWLIDDFLRLNLFDFDEIWATNVNQYLELMNKLYPYTKYSMIDESAFGKFSKGNYKNVAKFIMPTYLNKIDTLGFSDEEQKRFVELKKENFIKVADKCAKMYPLNFEIDIKEQDKIIIFCGTWGGFNKYGTDEVVKMQINLVKEFERKGYVVFFKPHPRDIFCYEKIKNLNLLKTRLPLECYNLDNVIATISIRSFSSMQPYYYRNVAGFISQTDLDYNFDLTMKFIEEYTPSIDLLRCIDPNKYSKKELKTYLLKLHKDFLEKKPLLSQNKNLINLYNYYKKENK